MALAIGNPAIEEMITGLLDERARLARVGPEQRSLSTHGVPTVASAKLPDHGVSQRGHEARDHGLRERIRSVGGRGKRSEQPVAHGVQEQRPQPEARSVARLRQ